MNERLLIVDDDADQCSLLQAMLIKLGYAADTTTSAHDALERIQNARYCAILTDLAMNEMSGLDLCEKLQLIAPDLSILLVTGDATMETAIAAIRAGAYDYLTKPVDPKLLGLSVARAAHRSRLLLELERLQAVVGETSASGNRLLGDSPAMRLVRALVARLASSDASVLIRGETGTGKELVARAIHQASARARGPFVAINCASVPAGLLESELFGHARGAFTDARSQRTGLFVEASGGTLFLDEIGEMPSEMQAKLLRALQERTVRPVGSNNEVPFDVRILSATHRDLEGEVKAQRFRQDLYYRINVVGVEVPPLRERTADILPLASFFLHKFCGRADRPHVSLSPLVAECLLAYDWPGNVRELENCMERVSALARFEQAALDDLPDNLRGGQHAAAGSGSDQGEEIVKLEELERRHILRVLKVADGNKSRAAELLGLDRRTLYRKLDQYQKEQEARAQMATIAAPIETLIAGEADVPLTAAG